MITRPLIVPTFLALVVLCLCAQAQQSVPMVQPLFEHVDVAVPPDDPVLRYAKHYQVVRILPGVMHTLQVGSRLLLNLIGNVSPIGKVDRIERRGALRLSCFGHLEGVEGSLFILVVEDGALSLFVSAPSLDATFDTRFYRDDLYVVVQVGEEPMCGNRGDEKPPALEMTSQDAAWHAHYAGYHIKPTGTASCPQPQAVLDIAVYYTQQARQAVGGYGPMNARIQMFIDQCNEAYRNSQVDLRARLVRRQEVNYDGEGGGEGETQIYQLTDPNDGVLDDIHPDRDNYRADQVILLVDAMNYCGIAWCGNGLDPEYAFAVVQVNCTNYVFAHEIGHNQGCGHDRETGGCGFRSYAHGWRFWGNDGELYRTVMAYPPGVRIPHFSNPDVFYQGQPTGVPIGQPDEAHNAMVINETRRSRENFRLLDIWVDFGHSGTELGTFAEPFNTVTEGASQITEAVDTALVEFPTLYIKAGSRNERVTVSRRMRILSCGGTVRIGAP